MKVRELVEFLQVLNQDIDVRYSLCCSSEYGDYTKQEGVVEHDDFVVSDDYIKLCYVC